MQEEMLEHFARLDEKQQAAFTKILAAFLKLLREGPRRMTIEEYNQDIEYAIKRVEWGDYMTLEALFEEVKSWT
ncbi:hypothetical protein ACWKWU_11555 [Chitinophaga lutea]